MQVSDPAAAVVKIISNISSCSSSSSRNDPQLHSPLHGCAATRNIMPHSVDVERSSAMGGANGDGPRRNRVKIGAPSSSLNGGSNGCERCASVQASPSHIQLFVHHSAAERSTAAEQLRSSGTLAALLNEAVQYRQIMSKKLYIRSFAE